MQTIKRQTNVAPTINGNTLTVRAIVFYDGSPETEFDMGDVIERISPNCEIFFDPRCMATYGHKVDNLLGTLKAGTLKPEIDRRGVNAVISMPNTATANEVRELIVRGDLDGGSWQFLSNRPHCQYTVTRENGRIIKTITQMTVLELGPVAQQSYMGTAAELRSLQDELTQQEALVEKTKNRILKQKTEQRLLNKNGKRS